MQKKKKKIAISSRAEWRPRARDAPTTAVNFERLCRKPPNSSPQQVIPPTGPPYRFCLKGPPQLAPITGLSPKYFPTLASLATAAQLRHCDSSRPRHCDSAPPRSRASTSLTRRQHHRTALTPRPQHHRTALTPRPPHAGPAPHRAPPPTTPHQATPLRPTPHHGHLNSRRQRKGQARHP